MPVICPKCHHARPANASNPEWECPACGICYAKFKERDTAPAQQALRTRIQPARDDEDDIKSGHSWNIGLLAKILLLVACGWGINQALVNRDSSAADETVLATSQEHTDAPEEPNAADRFLTASPADVDMLHGLAERLEASCAHNKFGLSEQECIARTRARGEACATSTARRYPGKMRDSGQMEVVTRAYVDCIFER